MRIYPPPFVTGATLRLLYPEITPLLNTVPSHLDGKVRVYNAYIALDVVNAVRKSAMPPAPPLPPTEEPKNDA